MVVLALCLTCLWETSIAAPFSAEGSARGSVLVGPPETDDWFCSQPFTFENLQNGLGFSQNYSWMVADDYYVTTPHQGFTMMLWAIYSYSAPDDFVVQIRSDNPVGGPGPVAYTGEPDQVHHEETGYSQWGYSLWCTEIDLYMYYPPGKNWLALQAVSYSACYWLAGLQQWNDMSYFSDNNGSTWTSSEEEFGAPYEQFIVLSGWPLALERESWGQIKALFHW